MRFGRSAGSRGLPRGFDVHLQKSRKAFRCQETKVSGLTMIKTFFHANNLETKTSVSRVARLGRRGLAPDTEPIVCGARGSRPSRKLWNDCRTARAEYHPEVDHA